MNISDKNITTLLESRNEQALKLLSEKYGGLCSSISYNVLGNRSDSEEVTNDTYMKVWNTIPPEKPRSLCAYVAKIVRNLSLDKLRYNTVQNDAVKPMHCCQNLKNVFRQRTTQKIGRKQMSLNPFSTHF